LDGGGGRYKKYVKAPVQNIHKPDISRRASRSICDFLKSGLSNQSHYKVHKSAKGRNIVVVKTFSSDA